ncbi:hypothetical protein CFP56_006229 [Quercus suber]|uniref:Uncharacterized protein n=1 Tax=Quercus suber TaxID=58331 RepID=A0AAW0LBI7_QUESU
MFSNFPIPPYDEIVTFEGCFPYPHILRELDNCFHRLRLYFHRSGKTYPFLTQSSNDRIYTVTDDHTKTNHPAPGEGHHIVVHLVLALLRSCPPHYLLRLSFLPTPYLIRRSELL